VNLSEAIRLGAMLRPQAFGVDSDGVGTCAFGAAREAIGHDMSLEFFLMERVFPIVSSFPSVCPACGKQTAIKASIVSEHLNDKHRWTREQIADWVESVELSLSESHAPLTEMAVTR
jgi:hypothetical protein